MKTSDLMPPELDYWVAKAIGYKQTHLYRWIDSGSNTVTDGIPWAPSTNWSQGGPLIEKYKVALAVDYLGEWHAATKPYIWDKSNALDGPTPLIAAMRAIVASVCGERVDE